MKPGSSRSTANKPKKSTLTKTVDPQAQERLAKQKRNAFMQGFAINFILVGYICFAAGMLVLDRMSAEISFPMHGAGLLVLSLVLTFLWSRSPQSLGSWIAYRTNPILKKHVRTLSPGDWLKSYGGMFTLILLLTTLVMGWVSTEISLRALFSAQGLAGAKRIFASLVHPEFAIIELVLNAMIVTIFIALMATTLAVPVAFAASFFMARNLTKFSRTSRFIYNSMRFFANFTRSVEPLIWAIIFSVWVGIGPFAGMLALMLHSVAALTKLYSEQIENIDRGPMEAMEATGANRVQVVWYAVVPQIVLPYLSFTIYRWDINIRMATIIGLVGGGGIGTLLMQYQGLGRWNEVGTIILVIATVVWIMDYLSARIREAIY